MEKICLSLLLLVLLCFFLIGCSSQGKEDPNEVTETPAPTSVPEVPSDYSAVFDLSQTYQTVDGFGAGFTWYSDRAINAPYSEEILDLLFKDAGLSILRFKNEYGYDSFSNSAKTNLAIYTAAQKFAEERGEDMKVLYTSWSPTADLKSNNTIDGGGSLKRDVTGKYVYDEFGDWWLASVNAYRQAGIPVDYVSIQNECDFKASYDGCELMPSETADYASYADAFLATYAAFKENLKDIPLMIAPETMTVDCPSLKLYLQKIIDTAPESIYAIGHHLYLGGDSSDEPNYCGYDSFALNFMNVSEFANENNYKTWQTEFYRGTSLQTANIINNSMVYENLNAYIYWGGVWDGDKQSTLYSNNMIEIASSIQNWPAEHGYMVTGDYYAVRHFSEFIRPGYTRVETSNDSGLSIRTSLYLSPEKDKLVLVLINNVAETHTLKLPLDSYTVTNSKIVQSVMSENFTADMLYKDLGTIPAGNVVSLPGESVTTIVLDGTFQ